MLAESTLRRSYDGERLISDRYNDLAHFFLDPRTPAVIPYDPLAALEDIDAGRLEAEDELRGVMSHLGRLRYRVPDFPARSLMTTRRPGAATNEVALSDVDWREVDRLSRLYRGVSGRAEVHRRAEILEQILTLTDGQLPAAQLMLARERLRSARPRDALAPLQHFTRLEPNEAVGHYLLGIAQLRLERIDEAIAPLERALALAPDAADVHRSLGQAFRSKGERATAIDHYRRALAGDPAFSHGGPDWKELVRKNLASVQAGDPP
jgi:tetratricopeptide (TPR) repeat protein